ncbi:MAG: hypothetical protein AVDCRST_MAG68-4250 [uncultured Gemmatimonadetes bacterium]|uniref:Uncharacterized protein n=1 Tax=uncultured Gemmatimonadota bacterium TaxID=203437 RepID=A0A6J4MIA2_9BACT|nr:MAG: hypothetical protein AVDCRST_MAG68-4250 [uncultured Gemmatimonadota bacterium]
MTYARWSGVSPARSGFVAGWCSQAGASVSRSTRGTRDPAKSPPSAPRVSSTAGALSSSMKRSRSAGYAGSSGTYAPPALSTASSATIISRPRSTQIATRASGPTPSARRWRASRLARAFSSA